MSKPDTRLEAISLLRFLPPGTADLGELSRAEMREAGLGAWSAPLHAREDTRPPDGLHDYDEVLPAEPAAPAPGERVIELRFKAG